MPIYIRISRALAATAHLHHKQVSRCRSRVNHITTSFEAALAIRHIVNITLQEIGIWDRHHLPWPKAVVPPSWISPPPGAQFPAPKAGWIPHQSSKISTPSSSILLGRGNRFPLDARDPASKESEFTVKLHTFIFRAIQAMVAKVGPQAAFRSEINWVNNNLHHVTRGPPAWFPVFLKMAVLVLCLEPFIPDTLH